MKFEIPLPNAQQGVLANAQQGVLVYPNHMIESTFAAASQFIERRQGAAYTVLCGSNNSGKTLVLKGIYGAAGDAAFLAGVQRFTTLPAGPLSVPVATGYSDPRATLLGDNNDIVSQAFQAVLHAMKNVERDRLVQIATELLGVEVKHDYIDHENDQQGRHFTIDGEPGNRASTGSRLFLFLLACCLNSKSSILLIDEPELGLAPALQHKLKHLLTTPALRDQYCPHLTQVFVSTHSHVFLDRSDVRNNFVVAKLPLSIELVQVDTLQAFHDLQFRLLGNTLDSFFLPEAIIIVEGKTDLKFIKSVVSSKFPDRRVLVVSSEGDVKGRVRLFNELIGGLRTSPFSNRLFVVFDKTIGEDQPAEVVKLGVPVSNVIRWKANGIEYVYPLDVLSMIFKTNITDHSQLTMTGDRISASTGEVKTKNELCELVCALAGEKTDYPDEFRSNLLEPLAKVLS